jgi:hypothetical protein
MKAQYTPPDVRSTSSKWGMLFDENEFSIEVSFNQAVARLGRPFVIGDILELPSETQYTSEMRPVLKYLEVESVGWSVNGYTPNWKPTIQMLICKPALATQETQDIFGKLTQTIDTSGLSDIFDGSNTKYQDIANISQTIKADANTMVPEEGIDYSEVSVLSKELLEYSKSHPFMNLEKLGRNRHPLGVDAMPPNGAPYTQGDAFPDTPVNGDYHRLTYTQLGNNIAARLHRWSSAKRQWIYLEQDSRSQIKNARTVVEEFKAPSLFKSKAVSTSEVDENVKP